MNVIITVLWVKFYLRNTGTDERLKPLVIIAIACGFIGFSILALVATVIKIRNRVREYRRNFPRRNNGIVEDTPILNDSEAEAEADANNEQQRSGNNTDREDEFHDVNFQ